MFHITADDIRLLGDADLRELTARLCEAEVAKMGFSTASVTWGGHQNAADAGIDVRVDLAAAVQVNGWIPRPATGFQVKKTSMPRAEILKEMRPLDIVRDVIADLAARSGAYIIVSSEDVTDRVLRNRRAAMREAVRGVAGSDALGLEFYDSRRLATWTEDHLGVILRVREKIGRVLKGWRPFGPWADVSEEASGEYLSDERLRIHIPTDKTPDGVSAMAGLEQIRNTLRQPQGIVRLVGLSGAGKTRLAQALFQREIGKDSLHSSVAAYNLPTILDNMIYDQRLPAMAAVMIDNGGAERSLEYDTVSSKYVEFVEAEVLPRAEREANVKLSKNPDARMTLGGSSGGAVALTMAWFRPDLYHRILTYSGTFVNLRNGPEAPLGAYEYIEHLFPSSEKKPFRLWIQASENDNGSKTPSEGRRNWVTANSRLAKVLKDKGYAYQFVYSKGAGHTQRKVIDSTLPQALEYVWLDYKPQR